MSRPTAPGSARLPGEGFGALAASGPEVDPAGATQAQLRAWALRLRAAGELQLGLRQLLLHACEQAGLVGPAGDALRELSRRLSADASAAGSAAFAAADELERCAVAEALGPLGGDRP